MLKVSFLISFISYFFIGYWLFFYWVSGSYSVRSWISSLYLLLFLEEYDFSCFLRIPTFHFAKFDLFTGAISANHKHSSPWIQVRQFVLAIRGKSFLHSRIRYYANSDSCFQQTRLLVSDDVPSNPGPVTNAFKCSVCSKTVARNPRAVIVTSAISGATLSVDKSSRGIIKFFKTWLLLTGSVLPVLRWG